MGYGTYSSEFVFTPRSVPEKPLNGVTNVATTRSALGIQYTEITEDGGSKILAYNIYVDDGMDGEYQGPYLATASDFTWSSQDLLTLQTGLIYKIKYSATNIHGESELSDETSILLAEVPTEPHNLMRIDKDSLPAGEIRVTWTLPLDEGGDPVTGYRLYLDQTTLVVEGESTLNTYTFKQLSVGRQYSLGVAAFNDIGESPLATLSELAASVPQKLSEPTLVDSSTTEIEVMAQELFDGGDQVTSFAFARDNGPLTDMLP